MEHRTPLNPLLQALLDEASWSGAELVRQVGTIAAEHRLRLSVDSRAAALWLAGRKPRPPVPALVAEAFSRALGRPVAALETGLIRDGRRAATPGPETANGFASHDQADGRARAAGTGLFWSAQVATAYDLAGVFNLLTQAPPTQRHLPDGTLYSLALLKVPAWQQAHGLATALLPPAPGCEVLPEQVAAAERMAQLFSDIDRACGGGRARGPLAGYLRHHVAPLLHGSATPALRERLFRVAAQLAYLCAFMCFDDDEHALAQHYYRMALRFSMEAADPVGYAVTLREMSVQAESLGHRSQARDLAETAVAVGRRLAGPTRYAFLLGQLAVCAAADADRQAGLSALAAAERHLERASSQPSDQVTGGYHPGSLAHQEAVVRSLLGDATGATAAFQTSLRYRPVAEHRSRALVTARLAEHQMRAGHLDQAVRLWHTFLDDYPYLDSARITAAARAMKAQLRPHRHNSEARRLLARAIGL